MSSSSSSSLPTKKRVRKRQMGSTTSRPRDEITFSWTIRDFLSQHNLLKSKENIYSASFTASASAASSSPAAKFRLMGRKSVKEDEEFFGVFLEKLVGGPAVSVDFDVYVKKADGTVWVKLLASHKIDDDEFKDWGFSNAFSLREMMADKESLLPGGHLTIVVDLVVVFPGETSSTFEVNEEQLASYEAIQTVVQATESLLQDNEFSDVVLKCQGRSFSCHKAILAVRSSVFRAMFKRGTFAEGATSEVEIEDMSPEVLEVLVRAIYTDSCGDDDDDDKDGNEDNVQRNCEVMKAAEKYQLLSLKILCERKLAKTLSPTNAAFVLSWALGVDAKLLKVAAKKYVVENLVEISGTNSFVELMKEFPDALLCEKVGEETAGADLSD